MTPAVFSLIVFGVCVALFIWNKLPMSVTALLGLTVMVLTDTVSFADGFKNFSGYIVVLIASMMVVGKATFETGLAQVVGEKVIGLAHGNERLIVMIATALTGVASAFLSNVATLAIMLSILTGICASNRKVHFMNVAMPVGMAAVIGGSATLIGSTPQLTAQGILEQYLGPDSTFNFFTFSVPGFIIIAVLVVYAGFIGYPLGKKIWGKREEYDLSPTAEEEQNTAAVEPNKKKMRIMIVIFIFTLIMFGACDYLEKYIPNLNLGMVSLVSALLCVLTGCISHKKAIKAVNWDLCVWFCASLGIAAGLDKSGGGELIAKWFIGLFGSSISPFVFYLAFLILVVVLTQFLSNSTVLAIILPIVFPIAKEMGVDFYSVTIGLTMGAAMAVATPLANTTIGMTMVAKYRFGDYLKYAGPITLISLAILTALVPVLYPLAA